MSALLADPVLSALVSIVLKASVLLALAAAAQLSLRHRGSAATRHLVWTVIVGALLLLPILSAALPSWVIATRHASMPATILTPAPAPVDNASHAATAIAAAVAAEPVPNARVSDDEEPVRQRAGAYAAG